MRETTNMQKILSLLVAAAAVAGCSNGNHIAPAPGDVRGCWGTGLLDGTGPRRVVGE